MDNFNTGDINVSDFDIGKILGSGKYGKVYLSRYISTKMQYAMKIMDNTVYKKYYEIEVKIHKELNHNNITKLYNYFEDNKKYYLIMEYCCQGNLYQNLKKINFFSEEHIKRYVKQICSGVKYLHDNNILHRDLKLENLLIDINDNIKITDFGLSIIVKKNDIITEFKGTAIYLSPELIEGNGYHFPHDIWSIGIITYELGCGYTPFEKYDSNTKFDKDNFMYQQIKDVNFTYAYDIKKNTRKFISNILLKNPKERPTIDELLKNSFLN